MVEDDDHEIVALVRLPRAVIVLFSLGTLAIVISLLQYFRNLPWWLSWFGVENLPPVVVFVLGLAGIALGLFLLIKRVDID